MEMTLKNIRCPNCRAGGCLPAKDYGIGWYACINCHHRFYIEHEMIRAAKEYDEWLADPPEALSRDEELDPAIVVDELLGADMPF